MNLISFSFVLEQSLLLLPLIFGVYLSYGVLKITDLSVDGSFVFGAALYGRFLALGGQDFFFLGFSVAMLGGACVGACVSLIQKDNKIDPIIASILMVFMLYSINLNVMGKPNMNLGFFDKPSQFFEQGSASRTITIILINLLVGMILLYLFKSKFGIVMRAFGCHRNLLKSFHQNPEFVRMMGLSLSNALAALSGVLTAQCNGFVDIYMGIGMALVGIASVLIGGYLPLDLIGLRKFPYLKTIIGCALGVLFYFQVLHLCLALGLDPINLKLALGVLLILFLRGSIFITQRSHERRRKVQ